jgi:hypothetical protein
VGPVESRRDGDVEIWIGLSIRKEASIRGIVESIEEVGKADLVF